MLLNKKDIVVFDFETTGFSATADDPIQLAYEILERKTFKSIDKGNFYFQTNKELKKEIVELTGITKETLDKKGIEILDIIDVIENIFEDKIAVAHNAKFDLGFLNFHFGIRPRFFLDTCFIGKMECPQLVNHKLGTLATFANIKLDNAHNALYDVLATGELLKFYRDNGCELEKYINITTKADFKRMNG